MEPPPQLRSHLARASRIFLAWSVPVYVLPLLLFTWSQGLYVLRSWPTHLTFLIPAVVVGVVGALTLTNSSATGATEGAIRGAATGLASAMLGTMTSCFVVTTAGSEGRAWFGIIAIPVIFLATVTGFVVGKTSSSLK